MGLSKRQQAVLAAKTGRPWPVVTLAVDPARRAGAAVLVPDGRLVRLLLVREVETDTPQLEAVLRSAAELAERRGLALVLALEEWGRGGPLGLKHWLGLGAASGAWTRALALWQADNPGRVARVVRVHQAKWRHAVLPPGELREGRAFRRLTSDDWKRLALEEAARRFPGVELPGHNAAEAALLGLYAARSPEVGAALPKRYLKSAGFVVPGFGQERGCRTRRPAGALADTGN